MARFMVPSFRVVLFVSLFHGEAVLAEPCAGRHAPVRSLCAFAMPVLRTATHPTLHRFFPEFSDIYYRNDGFDRPTENRAAAAALTMVSSRR